MEIQKIKQRLGMAQVLHHYGLSLFCFGIADKGGDDAQQRGFIVVFTFSSRFCGRSFFPYHQTV
jgi:hypothetical protein